MAFVRTRKGKIVICTKHCQWHATDQVKTERCSLNSFFNGVMLSSTFEIHKWKIKLLISQTVFMLPIAINGTKHPCPPIIIEYKCMCVQL